MKSLPCIEHTGLRLFCEQQGVRFTVTSLRGGKSYFMLIDKAQAGSFGEVLLRVIGTLLSRNKITLDDAHSILELVVREFGDSFTAGVFTKWKRTAEAGARFQASEVLAPVRSLFRLQADLSLQNKAVFRTLLQWCEG